MKKSLVTFGLLLIYQIGFSQVTMYPEVYGSFGGHSSGSNVQVTWTAGEPLYETATNENSILTQGFNQAVYYTVQTGVTDLASLFKISLYPNPTPDILNISIQSNEKYDVKAKLFDIQGTLLQEKNIELQQGTFDLSQYPLSVYVVELLTDNKKIKTYKIQKKSN